MYSTPRLDVGSADDLAGGNFSVNCGADFLGSGWRGERGTGRRVEIPNHLEFGRRTVTADILPQTMFGVVNHDSAIGLRRVRAALSKCFDRIFPNAQHDEMRKESLATTEERHWNLPPIESETKAA
jgi:hypothetical protein